MEVLSSDVDLFEGAPKEWVGTNGNRDEDTNHRSNGKMTNLLHGIDNLVEREKLAKSSSEEDRKHCAQDISDLKTLSHSSYRGSRKATASPRAGFHMVFDS